ncbi:hypothetical protein, partial [Staphylococcus aureus]|uniref:hypothetical protein n=1 Tax=Staphylococcus aureus TaxID=1280 RepID=UPI001C92E308
ITHINNPHTLQQLQPALNNPIPPISPLQILTSHPPKQSSTTPNQSNTHLTIPYPTPNHPFNTSTIPHKNKLHQHHHIHPLHIPHFTNN